MAERLWEEGLAGLRRLWWEGCGGKALVGSFRWEGCGGKALVGGLAGMAKRWWEGAGGKTLVGRCWRKKTASSWSSASAKYQSVLFIIDAQPFLNADSPPAPMGNLSSCSEIWS